MVKILALLLALAGCAARAELIVPAFTAYLDPPSLWFGEIKNPGRLHCAVTLRLPDGAKSAIRLTVAGQTHETSLSGSGTNFIRADFGSYEIPAPGYQKFALESASGEPGALILDGPAAKDAHFNLKERRNAASVHLSYPTPGLTNIDAFYCEVTALEDPLWTYYMACGWRRGYFGMQVNSPTERRIIFSVWDSGNEGVDRGKVKREDQVLLIAKGDGVFSGDFGNEGTGGHSHLVYPWETGEKQRFIVTAQPTDPTHTIFSGYYFRPDQRQWMLISSWKAPKDGGYLRGLYSFNEDFGGDNGYLRRKALFGNQWIRAVGGQWSELTTATFSHDPTGDADRLDRFMGLENDQFFLSNGGFIPGSTPYGQKFVRPPTRHPPPLLSNFP